MNYEERRIYKKDSTGVGILRRLIQNAFVVEMFLASQSDEEIWIISPWITDFDLIDNRGGSFDTLDPDWGRRLVKFSDVLLTLLKQERKVFIVSKVGEDVNERFLTKLQDNAEEKLLSENLSLAYREKLHAKGIFLSNGVISGSMNFTYAGIEMNEEKVTYHINPIMVAEERVSARENAND